MSRQTWMQKNFTENYSKDPNQAAALLDSIHQRNFNHFRYALEISKCDPNLIDAETSLSVFQTALKTSNSAEFIRLCINNGANSYKKSSTNRHPIHYAIKSLCVENLLAFLRSYDPTKINLKFSGQNSLHMIIASMTVTNYKRSIDCIKILINHGASLNMPNESLQTPFFMLLKKQQVIGNVKELIDFILDSDLDIDFYTYQSDDMLIMMQQQNPDHQLPRQQPRQVNLAFMLELLNNRDEIDFQVYFKAFKMSSIVNDFADSCQRFLEAAVANGMCDTVEYLLDQRVDANRMCRDTKYQKPTAFIAASKGYFRILELLIKKPELHFHFDSGHQKSTLLHEVCQNFASKLKENRNVNFQKCFDMILKDSRCQVNAEDDIGCSALHYTVKYRNDKATIDLLKRGAFINEESEFHTTPIDEISKETLEAFLDECITTRDKNVGDVLIDYKFLITPNRNRPDDSADKDGFCREVLPLRRIAENDELRSLVTHPVLSSFLFLKWSKLRFLFYTNLILFSVFMSTFVYFIVLCQETPESQREGNLVFEIFKILSHIQLWMLMIREMLQCSLSYKHYFKNIINWFEIGFIILAWKVFSLKDDDIQPADNVDPNDEVDTNRVLRAVLILLSAFEFLQIVGTLPILSVSTHMVMLKRVSITFLKSIALYSILLLSFGLCFFTLFGEKALNDVSANGSEMVNNSMNVLNDSSILRSDPVLIQQSVHVDVKDEENDFKNFKYPIIAIVRVFVMLTGEFDASDLNLNAPPYLIIFTLFVFLITIVLFNLLNALAVSDTAEIRKKGELIDLIQRINVLESYERIIFDHDSWTFLRPMLRRFISLFPHTIPHGRIVISSRNNEILTFRLNKSNSRDLEGSQNVEIETVIRKSFRKLHFSDDFLSKLQKYSTMSPPIMKQINVIIQERDEKKLKADMEVKMRDDIETIKKQMEVQLRLINELLSKQSAE